MSAHSAIEWTEATWNPVAGCTHVSEGCGVFDTAGDGALLAGGCYAAREASGRLRNTPTYAGLAQAGRFTGEVRLLPGRLDQPLRWRTPRVIFVNSMSDLFHAAVPDDYVARVFATMALAQRHVFQVLTKRHARLVTLLHSATFRSTLNREVLARATEADVDPATLRWPLPNVWLGVSVENQRWASTRIPHLLAAPAAVRFVSCEPLLGPVDLTAALAARRVLPRGTHRFAEVRDLHWIIAGGESGPGARPMQPQWARSLRDQCATASVPFFFKQWGEYAPVGDRLVFVGKRAAGRELDGHTHDEYPLARNEVR